MGAWRLSHRPGRRRIVTIRRKRLRRLWAELCGVVTNLSPGKLQARHSRWICLPRAATTNAIAFTHSIKHKIQRELTHSTAFLGRASKCPCGQTYSEYLYVFQPMDLLLPTWLRLERDGAELQSCQCHLRHCGGQL